jgi:hypothetical protein
MQKLHSVAVLVIGALGALTSCDLYSSQTSSCSDDCSCYNDSNDCQVNGCSWVGGFCSDYFPPPDAGYYPYPDAPTDAGSPCSTNAQCQYGWYCSAGACIVGGYCSQPLNCTSGFYCEYPRSTCQPDCGSASDCAQNETCEDGACVTTVSSCGGPVTCTVTEPTCPIGQVPLIGGDCWTGSCEAYASCDVPPPCPDINDEQDCLSRSDCLSTYNGIDCTMPNGSACQAGDTGCTCASFVFASCQTKSN